MEITRPTLLVDHQKCQANVAKMLAKAKTSGIPLRPHFKTHHSQTIAEIYKEAGITSCTVSSVEMASYFAADGWKDISIAFPYNPLESKEISKLAAHNSIQLLFESEDAIRIAKERLTSPVAYNIKIDVGTHRTGVDPRNETLIKTLIGLQDDEVQFRGYIAHAGHTYGCNGKESVEWIYEKAKKELLEIKEKFGGKISYGDTPSCSLMEDFSWCDELRPGNFIFYDWMQHAIGSCTSQEIAVCLAAPVVAIHSDRAEVVVHAGAVHLSKDFIMEKKQRSYGKVVRFQNGTWGTDIVGTVTRLSQEHGILHLDEKELEKVELGTILGILPAHSCLAADLQGHYHFTTGERIEKMNKN